MDDCIRHVLHELVKSFLPVLAVIWAMISAAYTACKLIRLLCACKSRLAASFNGMLGYLASLIAQEPSKGRQQLRQSKLWNAQKDLIHTCTWQLSCLQL